MLGCRPRLPLQRSFCCCLGLGPQVCLSFFLAIYLHTYLWERLLALHCLTSFIVASQGPQLASLSGRDAEQCEDLWSVREQGVCGGQGKTRMLPANFTFSQISRGSF